MDPKRKRTVKVLLIIGAAIIGVIILGVAGLAGAGYYWWRHNGESLKASVRAAMAEGETAGRRTNEQGCFDQASVRIASRPGITQMIQNQIQNQTFVTTCLSVAQPTPGLCDGVPGPLEIMKSVKWKMARCSATLDANARNQCQQLTGVLQNHCAERRREGGGR
jgi:hypothetical protein